MHWSDDLDLDGVVDNIAFHLEIESLERKTNPLEWWSDQKIIEILQDEELTMEQRRTLVRSNREAIVRDVISKFYEYDLKPSIDRLRKYKKDQ